MSSENAGDLTPEKIEDALGKMTLQGVAAQVKTTLTESFFLVGFALLLGASNTIIGLLAAIPSLAQLLQIPASYLVEKYKNRKRLNFLTQLGNRLGILVMALIPFVSLSDVGLALLIGSTIIQAVFLAIGSPSWNSWLRDLVPPERLGRFFAMRMTVTGIAAIIASVIGGFFLSRWNKISPATVPISYSIVFLAAFLAGIIAVCYTQSTPEPSLKSRYEMMSFSQMMINPFKNENFRNLLWFSGVWTFSTSLAATFFTVYMLTRLNLGTLNVALLIALTQITAVLVLRWWGRISDRFSNKSILQVAVPIFMLGTFLWTFTNVAANYMLVMPLLILIHILTGFASAGVNLGSQNIGLKLAPSDETPVFLATRGSVIAIFGAFAAIIGGFLADIFTEIELIFSMSWLSPQGTIIIHTYHLMGIDFVFGISVIIGIYALHRLALVRETGEVDEKVVINAILAEARRDVRSLSTVDGLKQTFQAPIKVTKRIRKRQRKIPDDNRDGRS